MVVTAMCCHAALLLWGAAVHSPTFDEVGHLAAGISHWKLARFELYRVDPPLVRSIAALPVVLLGCKVDWRAYYDARTDRPEFMVGMDLIAINRDHIFGYFTIARWMCIPISLLGAYTCFSWAKALYGPNAGMLALLLWCFSPTIIGHGQLITPDVGAAAFGVLSLHGFWRWLQHKTWYRALKAGIWLGLAELAKTTWIVLFLLLPALWLIWHAVPQPRAKALRGTAPAQLAAILLVAVYVVNLGYAFQGSFSRLGSYRFVSRTIARVAPTWSTSHDNYRRGVNTLLSNLPVPFPRDYILGIDRQLLDLETQMWSYLRGQLRCGGWWYYYLYALVVKVPVGTWLLVVAALATRGFSSWFATGWRDEVILLAPVVVILTIASSQTAFNHHMRYVLPIFPFMFIWISRVAEFAGRGAELVARFAYGAAVWLIASSLWVFPHSLSYFNELAGGPRHGHKHLLDSNIDWGQDLFYLQRWLKDHPEASRLCLAYFGQVDPHVVGLQYTLPPQDGPRPGYYAVSVNFLQGYPRWARDGHGRFEFISPYRYSFFRHFKPVATAGYSIYIYHITLEEANRVRRQLGLPELPESEQPVRNAQKAGKRAE